eukprot:765260-Hanusia_phi.AAC.10
MDSRNANGVLGTTITPDPSTEELNKMRYLNECEGITKCVDRSQPSRISFKPASAHWQLVALSGSRFHKAGHKADKGLECQSVDGVVLVVDIRAESLQVLGRRPEGINVDRVREEAAVKKLANTRLQIDIESELPSA